jgi:hypothetical protein
MIGILIDLLQSPNLSGSLFLISVPIPPGAILMRPGATLSQSPPCVRIPTPDFICRS